jgi:hypothetical protein
MPYQAPGYSIWNGPLQPSIRFPEGRIHYLAYVLLNRAEGRVIDSNVGQDFENQPLP